MKLRELEKRLKQEPDNLGLRVQVAGLMREAGRSVEAVELYRSVALAYRDQGRTQQSIAVCRSILEIAPEDSACQGLLAMLLQRGAPSKPPPATAPGAAIGTAMPAAPEVPSLRPQPAQDRAPSIPAPVVGPAVGRSPTKSPAPPLAGASPLAGPSSQPEPRSADSGAARRSSLDETPLPRPVPYHVVDPTSQPNKISAGDLDMDAETRPGERHSGGLAQAARRISGMFNDSSRVPQELDLAAELDTRQRPKIKSEELHKLEQPPPTIPIERVDDALDELTTPPPPDGDLSTDRDVAALEPSPRGSDDAITPPPLTGKPPPEPEPAVARTPSRPSLPKIGPPPAKTPTVVSIPPKHDSPVTKLRPPTPQEPGPRPRPGMVSISRDSEDELTQPRDRTSLDDDED